MKKIIFCISLMISLFILLSCHDFHLQENVPVPDGYQRVVFRPAGSEGGLAKTVIMPDFHSLASSESSLLSLKADLSGSDGSNAAYIGSYSTGVVAELKTGITYTVTLSLVNDSGTVFLRGSKSVTPAGGGTSSESIELLRVVPETGSGQTGDIELKFTCSNSDFAYKILWPDGSTSSANNKMAREEVKVTKNGLSAGLHKVYFGLYTGETPAETDISFYKCIDVYVYAGQTSSLWINGGDTAATYDFAGEEGAFSSSETTYSLKLTAGGKEYSQDNLPAQVLTGDLTEDMHLQITLGVPGQKVEVFINNSDTAMTHTVSGVNSNLTSTLDYNLGTNTSLSVKVVVYSPDNANFTKRSFTIKNPYALSYSDTSSIAGLLGWSGSSAFTTETLDSYAGLSLTAGAAYTIYTKEELVQFSNLVNSGISFEGCSVELKSDISLEGIEWIPVGYYSSSENKPFKGTFNGGNFTVSDLNVDMSASDTDTAGFFGYVLEGNIENIKCSGTVKGKNYSGGIVGFFKNLSKTDLYIKNCCFDGNIEGDGAYAGGITGYFYTNKDAFISGCCSKGKINCATYQAAGIAASIYNGKVENCNNRMSISNSYNTSGVAGGIVGTAVTGSLQIINCVNYETVEVTGAGNSKSGGILGQSNGVGVTLTNCVNFGKIQTSMYSYGICYGSDSYVPVITNCYNAGSVTATSAAYSISGVKLADSSSKCYYLRDGTAPCPSFEELAESVCSTIEDACGGTYSYEDFKGVVNFSDYTYEHNGVTYPVPIECK